MKKIGDAIFGEAALQEHARVRMCLASAVLSLHAQVVQYKWSTGGTVQDVAVKCRSIDKVGDLAPPRSVLQILNPRPSNVSTRRGSWKSARAVLLLAVAE